MNAVTPTEVVVSKEAQKDLRTVPKQVARKFEQWRLAILVDGLEETRKIPGYHDEPLAGDLAGTRSVRLSGAYRAYYRIEDGEIRLVRVTGVDKHRYRK